VKLVGSLDYSGYRFIEPFMGSGAFFIEALKRQPRGLFLLAEKDLSIRALLWAMSGDPSELIESSLVLKEQFLGSPTKTWEQMKSRLGHPKLDVPTAATKWVYQRLAHGSTPRTRADGLTPNVIWSLDKAHALIRWEPVIPDSLRRSKFLLVDSYDQCFDSSYFRYSEATVFLDPPYYAPGKSACYPGHRPNDLGTAMTVIDSVQRAMTAGCGIIYMTHYYHPLIDTEIAKLATRHDYSFTTRKMGQLSALAYGRGNYKHGKMAKKKVNYTDCLWTFRRLNSIYANPLTFPHGSKIL